MDNLKSYRENEIKWYILAYLLLVVAVCFPNMIQGTDLDTAAKIEKLLVSTALSGAICTLTYVLDSIFSTQMKDALLYLGFTKMPGSTVFTRIAGGKLNDKRIGKEKAKTSYASFVVGLSANPKERRCQENEKWYAIYSTHRDDKRVVAGNRDFLLCRDLYIATVIMTILTATLWIAHLLPFKWIILGYLLLMLVVTNMAAHNKASRFVNTVIAVDLTKV